MNQKVITDLIERLVAVSEIAASDINCGLCEDFAECIYRVVKAKNPDAPIETFWDEELDDDDKFGVHCFIRFDGRYFDSETPLGVDRWQNLPIYIQPKLMICKYDDLWPALDRMVAWEKEHVEGRSVQ